MEKYTLAIADRMERGHSARRVAGSRIPATVYGQGMDPRTIWVDGAAFKRIFSKAGETAIIDLVVDGAKKSIPTIVHELQYEPLKHTVIHIDFYKVSLKEAVTADVPIVLVGESPAVKLGGTIMQGIGTLEVSALPSDLPHEIPIDISVLKTFDDSITVADITAPEKATFVSDPSLLIVGIAPPRVEEKGGGSVSDNEDSSVENDVSQEESAE